MLEITIKQAENEVSESGRDAAATRAKVFAREVCGGLVPKIHNSAEAKRFVDHYDQVQREREQRVSEVRRILRNAPADTEGRELVEEGIRMALLLHDARAEVTKCIRHGQAQFALPNALHRDENPTPAAPPPPEEVKPAAAEQKPEEKGAAITPDAGRPELPAVAGAEGPRLAFTVAFSPDGVLLASGSSDHKIRLWDAATGKIVATFEGHTERVSDVAFSADGALLASSSDDHTVILWDVKSGALKHRLKDGEDKVNAVAFSPEGAMLASHSADVIQLWEVETGKLKRSLEKRTYTIRSLAFSPDGKRIGALCDGVTQWDLRDGKKLQTFASYEHDHVDEVAFAPDWKRAATASGNALEIWTVTKYGAEDPKSLRHGDSKEWEDRIGAVTFSPDSALVVSAGEKVIKLWDAASGALRLTIDSPIGAVTSIAISPDGSMLAVAGSEIKFLPLGQALAASAEPE